MSLTVEEVYFMLAQMNKILLRILQYTSFQVRHLEWPRAKFSKL